MNESESPTPRRLGKRLLAGIAIALALGVIVTLAVVLLHPTPGAHSQAVSTSDPMAPAPSPTGDRPTGPTKSVSAKTVGAALHSFLASVAAIPASTSPTAVTKRLSAVATGDIVSAIQNQQQELKANGWTQKGTPEVTDLTVVSENLTAARPTAVVRACVDSSMVSTRDSSGKTIPRAGGAAAQRAINIYTLERRSGSWLVTAQTFPNNPTC